MVRHVPVPQPQRPALLLSLPAHSRRVTGAADLPTNLLSHVVIGGVSGLRHRSTEADGRRVVGDRYRESAVLRDCHHRPGVGHHLGAGRRRRPQLQRWRVDVQSPRVIYGRDLSDVDLPGHRLYRSHSHRVPTNRQAENVSAAGHHHRSFCCSVYYRHCGICSW